MSETFTPTEWATAEDKQRFLKKLIAFVRGGFKRQGLSKPMYNHLNKMFQHIAHYDIGTFYEIWFSGKREQLAWRDRVLSSPCYGDPAWTWSDVERAFKTWMRTPEAEQIFARIRQQLDRDVEAAERAQLAALLVKYPDAAPAQD